jgi:hypothetical protein
VALTLAQGGGRAGISFDEPAFRKVVDRYKRAPSKVSLVQRGLIAWAMQEAEKEAKHQLDTLVYQAPVSVSGYVRTGHTRVAVTAKGPAVYVPGMGASGTIHVDPAGANRKGFYYPFILNRGRTDIRYYPRPFWTATRVIMKVRYTRQGRVALKELAQGLRVG